MTKHRTSTTPSERKQRPTRACTARTALRLAPSSPAVQKPSKQQASKQLEQTSPSPPPLIDENQRCKLRSMWELASVINFFKTFFPILKLDALFSSEALENALLCPNNLLVDIHVALLKGILPPVRTTVNRETWLTVLYKKLRDRWSKVAEGPCPVDATLGKDASAYNNLDSATRLIILRALCECRLDQDDVRDYMEVSLKQGNLSLFRKERSGSDSRGTTYWYEDGLPSGYRLYKEVSGARSKEMRGRAVSPPSAGQWEVLATNVDEFRVVAEKLSTSRNRQEISLSKKLKLEVVPTLEEVQKKKERLLKRQHRQAALLDNSFCENGFTAGRARRERKQVTYTFAEFDRSINEAIKHTRKQAQSPETAPKVKANGEANGHHSRAAVSTFNEHSDDEHPDGIANENAQENCCSHSEDHGLSDERELSENAGPSGRDSPPSYRVGSRPPRYSKREYVETSYEDEDDIYSDDEIEGEAIYDDEFIRRRKRKKKGYSSSVDEEYNEHIEEDASDENKDDEEEDDDSGGNYSDDDEEDHSRRWTSKTRNGRITLRRSKRAAKKKVNYNAGNSDEEDEPPRTRIRAGLRINEDDDEPPMTRRRGRPPNREDADEDEDEDEDEPPTTRGSRIRGRVSTGSSVEDAEDDCSESSGARGSSFREQELQDSGGSVQEEVQNAGFSDEEDGNDEEEESNKKVVVQGSPWNHVGNGRDESEASPEVGRREFRFLDLNQSAPTDSPSDVQSDEAL